VVQPPTIGRAGQALSLIAITALPCCGTSASQAWRWSFGDGATSEPSSRQTVTHAWAAPGVYTVAAVFTDESGVSTFALTQIQITPGAS
jgi:PKD repeat protein